MTPLRELPELVQDSELQVTIRDNITIHIEPLECRDEFLPQKWELKRTIGRGGDGTVFLQQKIEGPGAVDTIAVKQMSLNADLASEDHDSKRYVRELEALAKFAQGRYSCYFVRSYGWYQDDGWLYICMEYCRHLDLGKHLRSHGPLSEESARIIASQILQGLVQMHRNKIAHRDLKPANILIHRKRPEDNDWWVVLGDLGLSRRSGASSGTTTIRGTPSFMAPETIGEPFLGHPNSADPFRADMWCLGETISCALTGHGTFSNNDQLLRYQKRLEHFPDSVLKGSGASSDVVDFIRSLMDVDPLQRLTAAQALNHPWIKANHTSHTRTSSTATSSTVQNSRGDASRTTKESESKPFGLENLKISEVYQTTQASAQWTQTLPMQSSTNQASQNWNSMVIDTELQENSLSSIDKPAGPEFNPKLRTTHTKSTPALSQAQILSSSEENESDLGQGDQKLKEVPKQWSSQLLARDLLDSFKQFSAAEKLRIAEMQKDMARESNEIALSDLKRFSEHFKLGTSVPPDLLPILSNDKEKQKQIEERQRRIEASIKQEALIRKFEAEQTSYVAPKAPQEEQEYVVLELKKTSPTPQGPRSRHAATRSWAPVATGGSSSRREELRPQPDVIAISDSESSTDSESDAEMPPVVYSGPLRSSPSGEVNLDKPSIAQHKVGRSNVEPTNSIKTNGQRFFEFIGRSFEEIKAAESKREKEAPPARGRRPHV